MGKPETGVVCKGSWAFGTACGKCARCLADQARPTGATAIPGPLADRDPTVCQTPANAELLAKAQLYRSITALVDFATDFLGDLRKEWLADQAADRANPLARGPRGRQ